MTRPLLAALAFACLAMPTAAQTPASGVTVRGSELVVIDGGTEIRGERLIGAVLTLQVEGRGQADVRIDAIARDGKAPADDVILYDLSVADASGAFVQFCTLDPYGERHAILQSGDGGNLAIWCTSGGLAKCVRFGYRPWAAGPDGQSLAPIHAACLKMLRGDYCGNDQPTTRDGMSIEFYDSLNIQGGGLVTPELHFEAAWGAEGALCVHHPRVPQNITLQQLEQSCPRLKGRVGAICTEAAAPGFGTPLLFNASRGDGIPSAPKP